MYSVTLESMEGDCWTVCPPCYGFMKRGVANRSQYNFYKGLCVVGHAIAIEPSKVVPFNQLKYIWNSGTHENHAGCHENPEWDSSVYNSPSNMRYLPNEITEGSVRWKSMQSSGGTIDQIRACAIELNITLPNPEWDYIDELMEIERWIDSESESIIRRNPHSRTMFGVQVDNNVPADRALNYLMWARQFTGGAGRVKAYLQARYVKGYTPMQSLLIACLLSADADWQGNVSYNWIASSNDSCIYPHYLISLGMGALYNEPTQIVWRQTCYCEMGRGSVPVGHQREDSMPRLRLKEARTGEVKELCGAMLMAIASHRQQAMWWKHLTIEVAERYIPSILASKRREMSHDTDISGNSYGQIGGICNSYPGDIISGLIREGRERNLDPMDVIAEMLNTPFTQPAPAEQNASVN